jgi:hypothetical protein
MMPRVIAPSSRGRWWLAALLALPQGTPSDPQPRGDPPLLGDEELRGLWAALDVERRTDVLERVEGELEAAPTLALRLERYALSLLETDPGFLPEDAPPPYFDPERHAPGQPIPRKRLDPNSSAATRQRERFFAKLAPRPVAPAWRYDWGAREIRRSARAGTSDHRFELLLAGSTPKADLAEAVVASLLDAGPAQTELAAFGHAYTDRSGNVYPGVTLYDAWSSGAEMEMPDVDVLGILHQVENDWKSHQAPVPASAHQELYARVGAIFRRARGYRVLREALAAAYLQADPALEPTWASSRLRLHGLWEEQRGLPRELAARLPGTSGLEAFLGDWAGRFEEDAARVAGAREREAALRDSAKVVRALLAQALRDAARAGR